MTGFSSVRRWINWGEVRESLHSLCWALTPHWRRNQILDIRDAERRYARTLRKLYHAIQEDMLARYERVGVTPPFSLILDVQFLRAEADIARSMEHSFFGERQGNHLTGIAGAFLDEPTL